ncbi:glycosyltransferase family 2 protein [Parabacteroides sp. AM08-6]|uniref:glycosyltransferase n=1 Tax=Parabacteroides sp. AM08-6 TaxID=2292053 RepID=UPI000F0039C2|nr:glycosyltransferase family 2 protein [Parabacteroides sp. AM08-6]RHJ87762.1 glycosyltransferase [Parabacteroides sp. AM08-6]
MDLINNVIGIDWTNSQEKYFLMADAILFLLFLIPVLYLLIFAFSSLKRRKDTYPTAKKKYRFAVLFPAYQEDNIIKETTQSFFKQNYPRDLYDVFVISDHMKDSTNLQLESQTAIVLKLNNAKSTKTYALQAAIRYIEEQKSIYDIIVVMDADNLVEKDFLEKINNAFYSGCSAVQTHRMAKNKDTSIAVLDAVSEEINNSIFRKGHTILGFSSALIGSGMAFDYDLFKDNIMKASDVGIDKQLEMSLLKENIYIDYLEDVPTYDEKIRGKNGFYNQRRRWLSNQFTNLFWGLSSLPKAILRGNWDYCDKLFQWMMPPRIILLGFIILFTLLFTAYNFTLSIKWWGLLLLLCVTFSLAIPDYLVNSKFRKAILNIPILFVLMFFNFFRLKGANKEFIHTEHIVNNNKQEEP